MRSNDPTRQNLNAKQAMLPQIGLIAACLILGNVKKSQAF